MTPSRLPARALVAGGERSAPTEAGAETGRRTVPTGHLRPQGGRRDLALPLGPLRIRGTLSVYRPNRQVRSCHDEVVPEKAAFQGGSQRGRCVPVARVQRPTEPAGETALPPPLELNYITISPSRTEKDEIIAHDPYGRGVSERRWRSAANRSQLPLRSVLDAPHWGAGPEPAGETGVGTAKLWETRPKSRSAKRRGILLPRAGTRRTGCVFWGKMIE